MTTELYSVHEEELVELVACLMEWNRIRHVLVEDDQHRLVGLVTHRRLLPYVSTDPSGPPPQKGGAVKEIMIRDPISVRPETRTSDALQMMREKKISALPVVRDGLLLGIITESDFYRIAGELLDDSMHGEGTEAPAE
jgi:CBS domain-containing protein